ncbi:MAG: hypothetical protein OXQ31_04315 [Spirochaetaceae bacterium]|nr:hypothetical protein [Spirochaetaceae bacterium]
MTDDEGGALSEASGSPFVVLPCVPKTLDVRGQPLDFALASAERKFLRKHLLGVRRPGVSDPCLLARLAGANVGPEAADLWVTDVADLADDEDRAALVTARQAAALAGIGRGVYAALVERLHATDGLSESTIHRSHLRQVIELYGDDACAVDLTALSAFLPNLSEHIRGVLSKTRDWLTAGDPDPGVLGDSYVKAERSRKGLRARLPDNLAGRQRRVEWDPQQHPLAQPLHYRWPNVRRLLTDLQPT